MAAANLESAIPPHLVKERTQPAKLPSPQYEPPFPAYASRFPESVEAIVMAIYGAQHKIQPDASNSALLKLLSYIQDQKADGRNKPLHWQLATCVDNAGYYNEVVIAYWKDEFEHERWVTESGFNTWWQDLNAERECHGWFKEVFYPPSDRFETVFSASTTPEGLAHMHQNFSGTIQEHVYWGSMRDRLPASQTDSLIGTQLGSNPESSTATTRTTVKDSLEKSFEKRIKVPGRQNMTVIRSGQDWSNTTDRERSLYLETMHPVLIRGMDFLRDEGREVGCISNRFMSVLDPDTLSTEKTMKTYGLGYFDDLSSLEKWSKSHKTHLDIFGRFLQYAKELENNVSLRLFHEVLVLKPEQQDFEYIGCHPRTGMMAALQ